MPLYWCEYGIAGAARTLVLHGGPGAHHDYLLPQLLEIGNLGGGRDLLFYDQRGGGRSRTDARDPITWETQVADVGAVMREFALDDVVVAGYSWGGLLAILYAAAAARDAGLPQVKALLLIDPAPINRHYRAQFENEFARRQNAADVTRMRQELAASTLRERDPEAYRQRNFELSVAGYFADPTAARDLTPFRVNARVQQSIWDSLGDFNLATDGTLAAITTRTLIVHGRQDPIPLASSEEAAHVMGSRATLSVIENCGHVPYFEQPDTLFATIDGFLRELS